MKIDLAASKFSLKLAVIGNVNAGKSTFVNSLLGQEYTQTRDGRSGSVLYKFNLKHHTNIRDFSTSEKRKGRNDDQPQAQGAEELLGVTPQKKIQKISNLDGTDDVPMSAPRDQCSESPEMVGVVSFDSSPQVESASKANESLRQSRHANNLSRETDTVSRIVIDIPFPKELGTIRQDTCITLYDTSGLNDDNGRDKHEQVIEDLWPNLDACIVVLDAGQAHACASILKNVKRRCDTKRLIPVTIVANKVDYPKKQTDKAKVQEIRSCVERVFDGIELIEEESLEEDEDESEDEGGEFISTQDQSFPKFIPISARHALLFRIKEASKNEQHFIKLCDAFDKDTEIFDNFGLQELGQFCWEQQNTLEDKLKTIYQDLEKRPELKTTRMEETNFDGFVRYFQNSFGNDDAQKKLLREQVDFEMTTMSGENLLTHLENCHEKFKVLDQEPEGLKSFFWERYEEFEDQAFTRVNGKGDVAELSVCMKMLMGYAKFAKDAKWEDQPNMITKAATKLIKRQIKLALDKEAIYRKMTVNDGTDAGWAEMTHQEWLDLFLSILVCDGSKSFIMNFGALKITIWKRVLYIERTLDNPTLMESAKLQNNTVDKPITDPGHWGYLTWTFCNNCKPKNMIGW